MSIYFYVEYTTPYTPNSNTMLYLPFDNVSGVNDISGNGFNATLGTYYEQGKYNGVQCIRNKQVAGGSGSYITTPLYTDNSKYPNWYQNFTVSSWVLIENKQGSNCLGCVFGLYSDYRLGVSSYTSQSHMGYYDRSYSGLNEGMTFGTWNNIICAVSSVGGTTTFQTYINGNPLSRTPTTISTPSGINPLQHRIGLDPNGTYSQPEGLCFSDYIIEKGTRTSQQASGYYNSTKNIYGY